MAHRKADEPTSRDDHQAEAAAKQGERIQADVDKKDKSQGRKKSARRCNLDVPPPRAGQLSRTQSRPTNT